jgi:hypothetical protein
MGGISGVGRAALEKDWSMIGQQMLEPTMYGPRITKPMMEKTGCREGRT